MTDDDPFGFDISASSGKKRRGRGRRRMSGAFETSQRSCDHAGCDMAGQYRAPKSPDQMDEYYWFCKEHAREYNLKWNFFDDQNEEDYMKRVDGDRVWGRGTRPISSDEQRAWARLGVDDPHQVLGANATRNPGHRPGGNRRLPPKERRALEILDAPHAVTKVEVRGKYKALIKTLHPDMNDGNRADEERLQEVVWAWDQIKGSRNFRD